MLFMTLFAGCLERVLVLLSPTYSLLHHTCSTETVGESHSGTTNQTSSGLPRGRKKTKIPHAAIKSSGWTASEARRKGGIEQGKNNNAHYVFQGSTNSAEKSTAICSANWKELVSFCVIINISFSHLASFTETKLKWIPKQNQLPSRPLTNKTLIKRKEEKRGKPSRLEDKYFWQVGQ